MSSIRFRMAPWCLLTACVFIAQACDASDALLKMARIDVQTSLNLPDASVKTIFQSHLDKKQFYYLPSNIRFAKSDADGDGKFEPMVTLIKFNQAYNNGNWVKLTDADADASSNKVYQGGVFKATFTFGLENNELETMKSHLGSYLAANKATYAKDGVTASNFKLGRFPLDSASFMVTLTDPGNTEGAKLGIGPFDAPLTEDIVSVMAPLTPSGTDILLKVIEEGGFADAPVEIVLTMKYSGFDVPYTVKVHGDWDRLKQTSNLRTAASGSYWFFRSQASYEKAMAEMRSEANIKIEVSGQPPEENEEELKNRVMEAIMDAAMDRSSIQPASEDMLDDDQGKAPESEAEGELFGNPIGVSVGFAMKKKEIKESGTIDFEESGFQIIEVVDARFGKLDFSFAKGNVDKHLKIIDSSNWEIGTPAVQLSADVEPWFVGHEITMSWPRDGFFQTRSEEWTPGEKKNFGVFNFKKGEEPPVVPFTLACTFATNKQLEAAGLTGLAGIDSDSDETAQLAKGMTEKSLECIRNVYGGLYKGPIYASMDNPYNRQPTALFNRDVIPIRPERCDVKIKFKAPKSLNLVYDDEVVTISDIRITQKVKALVPEKDNDGNVIYKDGRAVMREETTTQSFNLEDIDVTKRSLKTTFRNIYLINSPNAELTLTYSISAEDEDEEDYERDDITVPFKPGETIDVRMKDLFPELDN